jgi:hypothetical protein
MRTSRSLEYGLIFYGEKSHILALCHVGKTVTSHKCLTAIWEFARDFGAPTHIKPNFDVSLKGPEWQRFTHLTMCHIKPTEPDKHHKVMERVWITCKAAYLFPPERVINLYKHLVDCQHNHRAHESNGWQRTPLEIVDGETPDISVFRFKLYEPIWFLHGPSQFTTRKLPGIQVTKRAIG